MKLAAGILLLMLMMAEPCAAQEAPRKDLPLPGEVFAIEGRTAFLIPAKVESGPKPWVWYAPTLPGLPGKEEEWMFQSFQKVGIAIGGIDAGESYGSPAGNKIFTAFYNEMIKRGYSSKPVFLGRSRGGLMALSWAVENPEKVGGFAGIYPVCNIASYPGVAKAAGAFEMKAEELEMRLKEFNPIDRLEKLAQARVPLFAVHGDVDKVVPLEANSLLMKQRYDELGGPMELWTMPDQGHNMWKGFFHFGNLIEFVKLHSGIGIIINEPYDYQVLQRNSEKRGEITVRGELRPRAASFDKFEYELTTANGAGVWKAFRAKFDGLKFEGKITSPVGGWHRLRLRAWFKDESIGDGVVEHVGIGEIFIVAGQSNSANHGEERQRTKTNRVVNFDGKEWRLANDPQPGASGEGGSFVPPLGDALVEKLGVPVAFVTCGVGATSVREWLPKEARFPNPPTLEGNVRKREDGDWESNNVLFERLTSRMKQLGPRGFRAVLWHQGESDANQADPMRSLTKEQYSAYLQKVILASREDLGWGQMPWFVAQVSYHTPYDEASPEIRAAQVSLWEENVALEGPDSDAIKGDMRENGGKGVHFSGAGLREHGKRWAEKIGPWVEKQMTVEK